MGHAASQSETRLRLTGNPGHARATAQPDLVAPTPPEYLIGRALYYFKRTVRAARWLSAADEQILAAYAINVAQYEEFQHKLNMYKTGEEDPGPGDVARILRLSTELMKDILRLAKELGLTSSTRLRLNIAPPRETVKSVFDTLKEDLPS